VISEPAITSQTACKTFSHRCRPPESLASASSLRHQLLALSRLRTRSTVGGDQFHRFEIANRETHPLQTAVEDQHTSPPAAISRRCRAVPRSRRRFGGFQVGGETLDHDDSAARWIRGRTQASPIALCGFMATGIRSEAWDRRSRHHRGGSVWRMEPGRADPFLLLVSLAATAPTLGAGGVCWPCPGRALQVAAPRRDGPVGRSDHDFLGDFRSREASTLPLPCQSRRRINHGCHPQFASFAPTRHAPDGCLSRAPGLHGTEPSPPIKICARVHLRIVRPLW